MKLRSSFSARKGFTLVELLVVIVIILTLASISFVMVNKGKISAAKAECINNMRQLWLGASQFAEDHNGRLPANGMDDDGDTPIDESAGWMVAVAPYLYGEQGASGKLFLEGRFRCPTDPNVRKYAKSEKVEASYETVSYVPWTDGSSDLQNPQSPINISRGLNQGSVAWLSDGDAIPINLNVTSESEFSKYVLPAAIRHEGGVNVLYVGGNIKTIQDPTLETASPGIYKKEHLRN